MNKLYSVITKSLLFTLLLGVSAGLKAQVTQSNLNLTINSSRTWSANFGPGNTVTTCNACNIVIADGVTLTFDVNVAFGSNNPTTGGGSTIAVKGSGRMVVGSLTTTKNVTVTLTNSSLTVGDASTSESNIAPGTANLYIGSGSNLTLLDNVSSVRLANQNNTITGGKGTGGSALNNGTAGQILYSYNGFSASFYSANWAYNSNALGHGAGAGSSYSGTNATFTTVTGPSQSGSTVVTLAGQTFAVASFSPSPVILPITLVDFAASLNSDGVVNLTWATDQEENSKSFTIQRSVNGGAWTSIGSVPAQGNSSARVNYSYTDNSPLSGTDSYRLLETDLDGKSTYSDVKVIRTTSQATGFSIFPNPARDVVNVNLTSNVSDGTIRLVDLNGKVLLEQKVTNAANTIVTVPVQNFAKGTYVLVVRTTGGAQFTGKVLITH